MCDDASSEEDEVTPTMLKESPPRILIVAHNGLKFDFPILCAECHRNGIDLERLAVWSFVDTLEVVKALGNEIHGGYIKLQCLLLLLVIHASVLEGSSQNACFS